MDSICKVIVYTLHRRNWLEANVFDKNMELNMITRGEAKYVYLDSTEKYRGMNTQKYTLTVALNDAEAKKLEELGVKVNTIIDRDTGRKIQVRKFSTQYKLDKEMIQTQSGKVVGADFGPGTAVEVLWKAGVNKSHGVPTFLQAIKLEDEYNPGYKSSNPELSEFINLEKRK